MFPYLYTLPDYRLEIRDKATGRVVSTGFFSAKQEEQIGEIIRGLNTATMTFNLFGILHEFEEKSDFGTWLAENTTLPIDPGL